MCPTINWFYCRAWKIISWWTTKDVLTDLQKRKEQEIKEYVAEIKKAVGDKYL